MKKWYLLLLGSFSLMCAQLRQYFVVKPTRQMEYVLKSIQGIEQEIQNLCKILKETFKELPDSFLYTPHSFAQVVSWDDLKKALQDVEKNLEERRLFVNEIADQYKYYEHPTITVYNYHEQKWLKKEIEKLLNLIKDFQQKGVSEGQRPKGFYYQPLYRSSIYYPSTFYRARERWQTKRPVQPSGIAAEQRPSELD